MPKVFVDPKFWIAVVDVVVSLALFFSGKYAPAIAEDVKIVILALQPVVAVLIGSLAHQEGKMIQQGLRG